jgi:hypothetical protein
MSNVNGRSIDEGLAVGRRLLAAHEYHKAVQCHRLISLKFPRDVRGYMALGQAFRALGNRTKMSQAFRRSILLQPDTVEFYYNFGNAERSFYQSLSAAQLYLWAIQQAPERPEIVTALSLALLQLGDWPAAWPRYEMRESCREFTNQMTKLRKTVWDGKITAGHRILLVAEQGAGDAIQFIRYGRFLAEAGMIVQVHCPVALERLFTAQPWIHGVSTKSHPEFDSSCLMMSLPYRFGTEPKSIPGDAPYLNWPTPRTASRPNRVPRVGLVWAGNPHNARDDWRSCPQDAYSKLLEVPGIDFQSLQFGWRKSGDDGPWSTVAPLSDKISDYADTAEIIAELDLVISVDTSIAHLAGALGKPTWLLLGWHADWRWLGERSDTPWYPGMRLFRMNANDSGKFGQSTDKYRAKGEGWNELLSRVAAALNHGPTFPTEEPRAAPG